MKVEIINHFPEGREVFYWTLYDGPDGIDKVSGWAVSLEEALTKILQWRQRISNDYFDNLGSEDFGEGVGDTASCGSKYSDPRCGDHWDPPGEPSY